MAIKEKEYKRLHLATKLTFDGNCNAQLLGHSMPFVDVDILEYEDNQPDQCSWLFAVLKTLFRQMVRFTEMNILIAWLLFGVITNYCIQNQRLLKCGTEYSNILKWLKEWKDVCRYWDMECQKAMYPKEPFNESLLIYFARCFSTKDLQMMVVLFILVCNCHIQNQGFSRIFCHFLTYLLYWIKGEYS